MTYYGQLSFNEIKPGENFELIDESKINQDYAKDFKKAGTFSAGIRYLDYGTFLETDEGGNELGSFTAAEYAFVLGWGKQIDSSFSVGANLKPIYSKLYIYY